MKHTNFAVFILSHGRPNNVKTLKTLKNSNYTGRIIIVCDNEDETVEEYKKLGKEVYVFDKLKKSKEFDTFDTFDNRKTIVYARNACFDIAKELGVEYFLELDDDYTEICFRYKNKDHLRAKNCTNADKLFDAMIDFLNISGAMTVAMSQAGDFIGGASNGKIDKEIDRKAMNSFFCKTSNKFDFIGRINEDVNSYITYGMKGGLMFTVYKPSIIQTTTQTNKGGMTGVYLDNGTYVKSFYSVITEPSCARVSVLNTKNPRIHHKILWNNCCPKILNEKYKK